MRAISQANSVFRLQDISSKNCRWCAFLLVFLCLMSSGYTEEAPAFPKASLTIAIPMRDGTLLPTDLYFPSGMEERAFPCILIRNPSGKEAPQWLQLAALSAHGYLVAIQSSRSAIDPEGKSLPYWSDGWSTYQDGYDTVEWLANSPYTNGKIGTVGFSAAGITQLLMAPTAPPSLKCQYISVAAASLYHHCLFNGGQLYKNQMENWIGLYAPDPGVHSFVVGQPLFNDFWQQFDTRLVADKVNVPAVHTGGWYDTFLQGTLDAFVTRQTRGGPQARGTQKMVIGPWTHFWPSLGMRQLGDFEIPTAGLQPPVDISQVRWFDHYLKGIANDIEKEPAVTYYVMGPFDGSPSSGNVWKHAETWPVPNTPSHFYLHADKSLVADKKETEKTVLSYTDDPSNPVPTLGGRNLFLESGPKDQRPLEARPDVLVFTSEPLEEDLEVTGEIVAKIYFSADTPDTDVVVRLTDVYPDGRSILVTDGIARLAVVGFCKTIAQPCELEIDLASTSFVFAKGHSIRVSIASSNFPRYEKNLNVGLFGAHSGEKRLSKHSIFMGESFPSRIILPVVSTAQ